MQSTLDDSVDVQSDTHHDDGDHQRSQTDQVELLREQFDQFIVAALGEGLHDMHIGTFINKLDYVPRLCCISPLYISPFYCFHLSISLFIYSMNGATAAFHYAMLYFMTALKLNFKLANSNCLDNQTVIHSTYWVNLSLWYWVKFALLPVHTASHSSCSLPKPETCPSS